MNDRLLSLRQVSEILGISVRAVYRLIADQKLPRPVKIGRVSRFYQSDVEAFMESLKEQRV